MTVTVPAPAASFSLRASSTPNSSYGLSTYFRPSVSTEVPSLAAEMRLSESGTRFTQTMMFMRNDSQDFGLIAVAARFAVQLRAASTRSTSLGLSPQ